MRLSCLEQKLKRLEMSRQSIRDLCDTIKHIDIWITKVPRQKRGRAERILKEYLDTWIFKKQWWKTSQIRFFFLITYTFKKPEILNRINTKWSIPRQITVKLSKDKEQILKAVREKQLIADRWSSIRLTAGFSSDTMETRRRWNEIFKMLK